ncbi:methyltransferase domain-containing protein [Polaromonas sp. YR568]|uniref:class I SAM-dependent methyltransferase n=1 Tax=Polaromonas sp. YR568 TaxID=1855301 RepID=UPI00313839AE
MTSNDKLVERERYDARARSQFCGVDGATEVTLGSKTMAAYLQAPYLVYEQKILSFLGPGCRVLELGAGAGLHTRVLLDSGAQVTASDISPHSLSLLRQRFLHTPGRLDTAVADMECLPFANAKFDAVVSAGSLSYGEPQLVDAEIRRVLRPGGMLMCVDSLNHNPLYRLNRWLHYRRGNRSLSTLKRMPDLGRIEALGQGFESVEVQYFGAFSYLMPVLGRLSGENTAAAISDRLDRLIGVKRSGFKFVFVAKNLEKSGLC